MWPSEAVIAPVALLSDRTSSFALSMNLVGFAIALQWAIIPKRPSTLRRGSECVWVCVRKGELQRDWTDMTRAWFFQFALVLICNLINTFTACTQLAKSQPFSPLHLYVHLLKHLALTKICTGGQWWIICLLFYTMGLICNMISF